MNIAVLADIHGNLAALQTVVADIDSWRPDAVIVAGDIVNRGPQSGACLDMVLRLRDERGWQVLRGNHEEYVLRYERDLARPDFPRSGPRFELSRLIDWTYRQVSDRTAAIAALPEQLVLPIAGGVLHAWHASLRHNRDGVLRDASDEELLQQIDPAAAIFCVGHTHMPFVRQVGRTLLVNVGSVGLPFDGDTRAAYARISLGRSGWSASIVRLAYDLAATERAFVQGGTLAAVGPIGDIMLRELQTGTSLLFDFFPAYTERMQSGALSIEAAVREFMADRDRSAAA